jgi:acetyltransferase-like isoleucine patch superfamily enzyme
MAKGTALCDFVIVYPHCVFLDDKYPPSQELKGAVVNDYVQIGARSVILPAVEIGQHALIASGSTVTRHIGDFDFVAGIPAKRMKDVREIQLPSGENAYPWPTRFDRGMPWRGMDYQHWLEKQQA